jgi:hypothetical protein
MAAKKVSKSNVISDVTQTLQKFDLLDLEQCTQAKSYSSTASKDFHLFYVGRDDVHDILKHILSRVSVSLYLNMFGFDDEELDDIMMAYAEDPSVPMLITLEKSQAGGVHERKLLDSDIARNPTKFNTYFVIGQSATHQISHSKGFVADGNVGGEGSTNWSVSGEGIFVVKVKPGGPGLQGAEQYPDDLHRSGHGQPVPDGVDRGAHGREIPTAGPASRTTLRSSGHCRKVRARSRARQGVGKIAAPANRTRVDANAAA